MSRIDRLFADRRAENRRALVVYLCVGDPSLEGTVRFARAALEAGADALELGVPFSDPTADGPAIARASERAIAAGSSLGRTFEVAAEIRKASDAPLVLFGYYNPILIRGEERSVRDATAAGFDALLVVDLPPEEGVVLRDAAQAAGLAVVPLLTPTSAVTARTRDASSRSDSIARTTAVPTTMPSAPDREAGAGAGVADTSPVAILAFRGPSIPKPITTGNLVASRKRPASAAAERRASSPAWPVTPVTDT